MNYIEAPGAFSDAAMYMYYFFNEERILSRRHYQLNGEKYLNFYFEAKGLIGDLPPSLHPFCYQDETYSSLIVATVYDRGFADVTPEVMREYYSHTWFAGRVFKHWFSNYTDVWPKDREDLKNFNCLEWAEKLNVPEDVRYKLLKIFADFESAQNLLLDTLLGVYEKILLLRQKHENVIQNAIRFFNTDESFLMLQAITGEDLSDYDFTVTLINSIQISYSIPQKHVHLGKDALEVQDWEKRVTPKSFALAYSDELRRKIIKILTHKGPQTPQQLCEELGQSPMTISHNINFLFFEGIIMPCRNEQQEFAFRLNKKYFQILSQKLKGDFFK